MAKDSSSSHRVKDEENDAAKRRHNTIKGSKVSSAVTVDKSGLRKSASEDSSKKKIITRSLSTRKCQQIEKQTPPTPIGTRKSAINEKQQTPSPLRRSERGKKESPSASSELKKSDRGASSSDIKHRQERKEKRVNVLKLESAKISESTKNNLETGQVKGKRMDARAYKASFKKHQSKVILADHQEEQNNQIKLSNAGISSSGGEINRGNDSINKREELKTGDNDGRTSEGALSRFMLEVIDNNNVAEVSRASQKHILGDEASEHRDGHDDILCQSHSFTYASSEAMAKQTTNEHERAHLDFSEKDIQIAVCIAMNSPLNDSTGDQIDLEKNCEILSLKRKRNDADTYSDDSAVVGRTIDCTSTAEIPSPSSSFCLQSSLAETCGICFKRQRMNNDNMNQDVCLCSTLILQALAFIDVYGVVHEKPEASGSMKSFENCDDSKKQNKSSADLRTNTDQNACFTCKLGGKLLCCDGRDCGRSFHFSCLDPPLEDVPFGVWHCLACVKKKIEFGVHSVSGGVESIWDSRVEEVSDVDGLPRQRQYFVKYKDLAHVHNRWVPEIDLLAEGPSLLSKYDSKSQVQQWKQEWAVPHRLLQKRLLFSSTHSGDNAGELEGEKLGCQNEWLVKWHGLDYEHATWELENASFLNSSLIRNYENRCIKTPERKKMVAVRPGDEDQLRLTDNHLGYINKLCEFWHNGHNAIVIDDQDRIAKVVAFILMLQPGIYRPFLIISTHTAISLWDNEFLQSAPSVNTVVYKGSKRNRNIIRSFDFFEGGCITFEVLVIPSEIILEDLDVLDGIKWEAVVVDECERRIVASKFEQIKKLNTNMKLLLFNHLKESKDEYVNVLSLLDFNVESSVTVDSTASSIENIGTLKERFSRHIAYAFTSRFSEYWVPAQISHVQLEQYCSTLLLNSLSLCSSSRNDHVGALRDILISTRKCCNHPYILDPSLQTLLTKGREVLEYLDVGIEASGKLQLLDAMLVEMKKRGLRVLILFKSNSGSGRDSIGDILDDFLRQRFGADSYERVEGGLLISKKLAALNKFNDNESQRFVFLLEIRACLPSIKLSSVDSVIIYDSDWTPMNDLRALQKITIDSQFDQIKIFRLYSSCTVEEKVLMLALQNKTVDNSLQNISPSTSHRLLMWGALHLFDNLEKFHGSNISALTTPISAKESLLQDVVHDLVSILPNNDESSVPHVLRIMLKAQQVEGSYHTVQPLLGELKISQMQELLPHLFWSKLLNGKHPRWIFSSVPCQRNRKRAQCQLNHEMPKESDLEGDKVVKRRKKVSTSESQTSLKVGLEEETTGRKREDGPEGPETMTLCSPRSNDCENNPLHENNVPSPVLSRETMAGILEDDVVELDEEKEFSGTQTSLYHRLRPGILKLCQILQLPENVKYVVKKFFVYVVDNHHVSHGTATILQAFQLSLCWTAAYWLNYKISHKESMAVAKEKLNFDCKKEEADFIYSKLRCLRNMFLCNFAEKKVAKAPVASEILSVGDRQNLSVTPKLKSNIVRLEVEDLLQNKNSKQVGLQPEMDSELVHRDILKCVKLIKKKCGKQLSKRIEKLHEQKDEVKRNSEEVILRIEKNYRVECAVIRHLHGKSPIGTAKLKILEKEFAKKVEDQKNQMEIRLKNLEAEHLAARNKVKEKEAHLVEELKSWAQVKLLNKQSPNNTRHKNSQYVPNPHAGEEFAKKFVENLQELREKNSEVSETISDKAVECSGNVNSDPCRHFTDPYNDVELGVVCKEASTAEVEEPDKINSSSAVLENAVTLNSCSVLEDSGVPTASCVSDGDGPLEMPGPAITNDSVEHLISLQPPIPATLTFNGDSCLPDKDASCKQLGIDSLSKAPDGVPMPTLPVYEVNQAGIPDEELLQELSESIRLSVSPDRVMPINQEKNPSEAAPIILNEEVPLGVPGPAITNDSVEHLISLQPPIPATLTFNGDSCLPDKDASCKQLGIDSLSKAPDGVPIPTLPVYEVNQASTGIPDEELLQELSESIRLSVSPDRVMPINQEKNPSEAAPIILNEEVPLGVPGPAITNDSVGHLISLQPPIPATLTFNGDSCLPDKDASCKQLGIDSLSKAPDGVPIPTLPVYEVNQASTGIPEEELLQELSESIRLSVSPDRVMPINQEKNPSEAAPIILNEEVPLGVSLSTPENLPTLEDQSPIDVTVTIPDEEILPQTLQSASDHVAENNNSDSINGMDLSVSDYGLEINQQDTLSNVNSHILLSNEMSLENFLAVLPSGTTLTQGTPVPSNQGQIILPSSYPESLVPGTLFHSAVASSSRFDSSQQAAVNFVAQPPGYLDPLQNELERIRKEIEDLIKASHEKKVQLKSDCDKEIEEVIAQIRSKYDTKLQDTEAELILRKKELDGNYYKVLMNKRLSYAFRSKCIDLRLGGTPGLQQDVISTMQHRHRPQANAQRPPLPVQTPTTSPSSNLTASSFQPISLAPNPHPSPMTNRSTLPNRPPLISSVSSSAANLQVGGAIRSPAPHLQPFRPPTISPSSLPRHTPSLQVASNRPPSSSPAYPQLQPQLPLPSNHPITCSGAPELNGLMNFPTPNTSLSALGLFMDLNRRPGVDLPNSADFCSNLNASSTMPAGTTNSTQVNLRDGVGLDVVCLSDDE